MRCQTVKQGTECFLMSNEGCGYNGGTCYPIVESCQGCGKTETAKNDVYCQCCPNPEIKWKNGFCNLATHVKGESVKEIKLNPLKASKRLRRN